MIKKIECLSTVLKADKKVEFEIETISLDGNLYDGDNVSLEMTVIYPDLTEKCFYGFYYGDNKWRFRLCFYDGGEYTGRIILRKSKSIAAQKQISFVIEDNEERKGLLQVEKVNKKHFQFRNGEVFTAVGENIAWGERGDNGNFYERVCPKLHKFGGNWTRLWLTTEWYLNMLPKNSIPGDFSDSTQAAELLDKLIETFEKNGIYVQLVLFNHTNLNSKRGSEHDRNWHDFTFNSANANGYLDSPDLFFTSERAKKDVKNYIRYIVSRYGYSNNILCWELFNEVNMAEARNEDVYSWHREMVGYLREIDSMGHMITTSSSTPVYSLIYDDMFDFINQHRYGAVSNIYHMISDVSWISLCYRKPVILSECGSSWTGSFVDRTIIHQHLWAGLMCNSAGTGMHWFWENIDKLPNDDGYRDLKIVSDFAQNIPWNANGQTFITAANIGVDDDKVNALGYKNSNYYYLWFYDAKFTFCNQSENIFKDTEIRLELENGDYEYSWLDSWTGQIIEKSSVSCDCGSLCVKMPAWKKDITFSIKKRVENE